MSQTTLCRNFGGKGGGGGGGGGRNFEGGVLAGHDGITIAIKFSVH